MEDRKRLAMSLHAPGLQSGQIPNSELRGPEKQRVCNVNRTDSARSDLPDEANGIGPSLYFAV